MKQFELETSNENIEVNLKFNNIFANELIDQLNGLAELTVMVAGNEYGWLSKAQSNVLKELMSWKNGN